MNAAVEALAAAVREQIDEELLTHLEDTAWHDYSAVTTATSWNPEDLLTVDKLVELWAGLLKKAEPRKKLRISPYMPDNIIIDMDALQRYSSKHHAIQGFRIEYDLTHEYVISEDGYRTLLAMFPNLHLSVDVIR